MGSLQSTKSWLSKKWKKRNRNKTSESSAKDLDLDRQYEDENKNDTTMTDKAEDKVFKKEDIQESSVPNEERENSSR